MGQGHRGTGEEASPPPPDINHLCPSSSLPSELLLIFPVRSSMGQEMVFFPKVPALGDPCSLHGDRQTQQSFGNGSQAQEQVGGCKNKGDLAVSWLEQDERAASLSCVPRAVLDSSAANHFFQICREPWDKMSSGTWR